MGNRANFKKAKIFLDNKDWLHEEYITKNRSSSEIGEELSLDPRSVSKFLKIHNIKKEKHLVNASRQRRIEETNLKKYGTKTTLSVPEVRERTKKTMLEKYGSEHALQNKELRAKVKKTSLERYGETHYNKSNEGKEKFKKTCLAKYGVSHYSKKNSKESFSNLEDMDWLFSKYVSENLSSLDLAKELEVSVNSVCRYIHKHSLAKEHSSRYTSRNLKSKKIWLEKYDVDNPMKVRHIKEKLYRNNLRKYGASNPMSLPQVQDKARQTNLAKFGTESPLGNPEVRDKIHRTNLEKYGVKNVSQNKEIIHKIHQTKKKNGSYGKSIAEDFIGDILETILGIGSLERQHSSDEYPFACDFYSSDIDIYVEYQGSWTHGVEPYKGNSLPNQWAEKASESLYYKNAIETYTQRDPLKRKAASDNNLNYLELWHSDYVKGVEWLCSLIQKQGLPLSYKDEVLQKELKAISSLDPSFTSPPRHNKIVEHFQPHFYRKERELWNNPIVREKLIANREKYKEKSIDDLSIKQILQGFKISGAHIGYSFFSPLWLRAFVEKYGVKSIYDPCAGWGHRLLGAFASGVHYIGNDISEETYGGLCDIRDSFEITCELHCEPAEDFVPEENYDAVLTCPPYFDTELYGEGDTSTAKFSKYGDWLNIWWRKVIQNSLNGNPKYFAFIINNKYKEDMVGVALEEGLFFKEEIAVGNNQLNHFQRTSKNSFKGESLIVFDVVKKEL